MTFAALWAFLAVALPTIAALAAPMSTVDLAYQVRAGELMLDAGQVLRTDPFTFTVPGQPWLDQQWLGQVAFALLYRSGGWGLVALAHAALVGTTFGLVRAALRRRGLPSRPASWLTLSAFVVSAAALAMRPQLLGIALFALVLWLLARGGRWTWAIPIAAVAWANVHGSFPLAAGMTLLAALEAAARKGLGSRVRSLTIVGAAALVATFVNPFGLAVWPYAVGLASNSQIGRLVTEWQRTTPFSYAGLLFYVSLVVTAVVAWRVRRQVTVATALGLIGFAALGAYAERGTVWWALGAPWLLAPALAPALAATFSTERDRTARSRRPNLAIAGLVAALGVALLPWPYRTGSTPAVPLLADAPEALTDALLADLPIGGRLLATQTWASWAEISVPGRLTFVDSRIELFPVAVWDDYLSIAAGGSASLALLDRWQVDAVLVSRTADPALLATLESSASWRSIASTAAGAAFLRRP